MRIKLLFRIISIALILALAPTTVMAAETDIQQENNIYPEESAEYTETTEPAEQEIPADAPDPIENTEPVDVQEAMASVLDATDGYSPADIAVIDTIISAGGLSGYTADEPAGWDFVRWNEAEPKNITGLDLSGKNLTGDVDMDGLAYLEYIVAPDGSVLNIEAAIREKTGVSYHAADNIFQIEYHSGGSFEWTLGGGAQYAAGYGAADNPVAIGVAGMGSVSAAATAPGIGTALDDSAPASIAVTGVVLAPATASVKAGKTVQLTATVSPADATDPGVTWTSGNPAIAAVTQTGLVTGKANGSTDITVTTTDGGFTAACKVTVTTAVTGVKLNYGKVVVGAGKTYKKLKATAQPATASNKAVTWKSDNKKIAKIDKNTGVITGVKNGTTKVTATTKDGKKTATCTVIVGTPVKKVGLSKAKATIFTGKKVTLKATLSPNSPSVKGVTWKSSDKSIATVDSKGIVKGLKKGKATITATAKDGSGKKATCVVTVRQAVKKITLNKTSRNVLLGKSYTLKVAEISPSNAYNKNVTWKSSNPKVATVSSKGKVKGIKAGTVTITATAKDGSGKKATCKIYVRRPVKSITLNQTVRTVPVGASYTLKTKSVLPGNAYNKKVNWKSSDAAVATVTSTGKVVGIKNGKVTITATAQDGSGVSAKCTIYVGDRVSKITLSAGSKTLDKVGDTRTITAAIVPATAKYKSLAWSSDNKNIAKVSSKGVVTATGPGKATITAKAKDGSGVTGKITIEVKMTAAEARIYAGTQKVYNEVGTDLYANYKWVVNNLSYVRRSGHLSPPGGYTRAQWYAVEGLEKRSGNCYTYAAAFCELAKGLGYDAQYVEGDVYGTRSQWWPHGFVLIKKDGATYICDPELEYASAAGRNLYMQPVSSPRATYRW